MVATLAAFIAGSVLGAFHRPGWDAAAPSAGPRIASGAVRHMQGALADDAGAACGGLGPVGSGWSAAVTAMLRPVSAAPSRAEWLQGPWPLIAGALGLAAVNVATLVLAGRPWGITSGFALWGSKALAATGVDVASWPYWQGSAALEASVFSDITSVMNMGILFGALTAAGLAGRFSPAWQIPARSLAAALIGGLLAGLWRPYRLRMQYRGILQRGRFFEPARLALACRGFCGERGWASG